MADEVIIGNVGGTDGVASEATLQSLVRAIEKMNARAGGPAGAGSKVQKLHENAVKKGTKQLEENTEAFEENTDTVKESTSALNKFADNLGSIALQGVGQLARSFLEIGKEAFNGSDRLSDFAQHIPVVGSLLASMAGYFDDSFEAFRKLSMTGASFNNDLVQMRKAAAGTRLSLEEFTNLVGKNSDKLAAIGGTATKGVNQLVALNKGLGAQREQLLAMGFTMEDVNEALLNYAYITRAGSRAEKQSQTTAAQTAQYAASYAKNLTTLSKLTGQDVKSMQEKLAAQSADVAFQMKLAKLRPEERAKVEQGLADALASAGETGALYFKQQFLGMPPLTKETQLLKATMGGTANSIERMVSAAKDAGVSLEQFKSGQVDRIADVVEGAAAAGQNLETLLAATAAGAEGPGKEIASILQGMGKQFTDYMDENGKFNKEKLKEDIRNAQTETQNAGAANKAMGGFNDAIRGLSSALQNALISSGLLDLFIKGITSFTGLVNNFTGVLTGFVKDIEESGFWTAVGNAIVNGFKALLTSPPVIAGLVGGLAALFLAKSAVSALGNVTTELANNAVSKVTGLGKTKGGKEPVFGVGKLGSKTNPMYVWVVNGATGGMTGLDDLGGKGKGGKSKGKAKPSKAGKGFGQVMGGITEGLGEGIEGILTGLANGLKAFSSPLILKGAAILSGSIVIIGAGIAGATWLLGKALPTFVEGLKGFNEIDGGNLLKVAGGIAAVGAAMAVLGAGQLVSAVTGMLGGLAEGIAGFFGAEPPLKKLEEFSKMNIDPARVEANAKAVVAYSNAVSQLSGNIAQASITNLVSGIAGFFGGEVTIPWNKVKEFERVDLDAEKVKNNANAVAEFARAMQLMPEIKGGTRTGGVIGAIADFFSGKEQVPWTQVAAFGKVTLPVANIKANAEAVVAFSNAIKSLPEVKRERTGGVIGAVADFFLGAKTEQLPWDQVIAFGQVKLPNERIKKNAEALAAFGDALSKMPEIKKTSTGGVLGAIGEFFGGKEQVELPWVHLATFGNLKLRNANIKANAESLAAFGEALSKMPEIKTTRSGGVIGAIANFFMGGEKSTQMPWEDLISFGAFKLDTENIKNNADAVTMFATAMKNMPEIQTSRSGGILGGLAYIFEGEQEMPWDQLLKFSELKINATAVVDNANALTALGKAFSTFSSSGAAPSIPSEFIENLEGLMEIGNDGGLQKAVESLQAIGNIKDLSTVLTPLSELDPSKVTSFSSAIRDLASAIAKLNDELSKDTDEGFLGIGGGDKANAGELLKNISLNTNAGAGNTDQLNSTMVKILEILRQMKDLNDKIEKNTKYIGGSDISSRGITRY